MNTEATITYTTGITETYTTPTAKSVLAVAVYQDDFKEATMYGYTLRIVDADRATLTIPGTPGLSEDTTLEMTPAEARGEFRSIIEA